MTPVRFVHDAVVDGRRARVHTRRADPVDWRSLVDSEVGDDDRQRLGLLANLVATGSARGVAHPEIGEPDVLHVYLDAPGGPVFACVLLPEARALPAIDAGRDVVEGASLEVVPDGVDIDAAIGPALQSWARRNLGAAEVVRFDVAPWLDPNPDDLPAETIVDANDAPHTQLATTRLDGEGEPFVVPRPEIAA